MRRIVHVVGSPENTGRLMAGFRLARSRAGAGEKLHFGTSTEPVTLVLRRDTLGGEAFGAYRDAEHAYASAYIFVYEHNDAKAPEMLARLLRRASMLEDGDGNRRIILVVGLGLPTTESGGGHFEVMGAPGASRAATAAAVTAAVDIDKLCRQHRLPHFRCLAADTQAEQPFHFLSEVGWGAPELEICTAIVSILTSTGILGSYAAGPPVRVGRSSPPPPLQRVCPPGHGVGCFHP
jgi:hypothetical protein